MHVKQKGVFMLENGTDEVSAMSEDELYAAAREEAPEQTQPAEQEVELPVEQPEPVEQEEQEIVQPAPEQDEEVEEPETAVVDKAQKGMQREISEQRKRRREVEQELAILKAKIELQTQQPKVPEPKPFDNLTDDELVDGKAIKTVYSELEATRLELSKQRELLDQDRQRLASERLSRSVKQAQAEFGEGKVKEGYEYDTLMKDFAPIVQSNEQLSNMIRNSENPALEAYKQALIYKDPTSLVRMPSKASKPARPAPKTLGSAPAGGGQSDEIDLATLSAKQLSKLSDDDLEKLARTIG